MKQIRFLRIIQNHQKFAEDIDVLHRSFKERKMTGNKKGRQSDLFHMIRLGEITSHDLRIHQYECQL